MENRVEFGGSLPVESVQALASKKLDQIPPRYIRPDVETEKILVDGSLQIPVIDMCKLERQDTDELAKLHFACKEWGFFQVFLRFMYVLNILFQ